jgi:hypothetical protein
MLDAIYGEASPSYPTVKEVAKQFCLGRDSVEDEPREVRPVEVVNEENFRHIKEELLNDKWLTLKEISVRLEILKTFLHVSFHKGSPRGTNIKQYCISISIHLFSICPFKA